MIPRINLKSSESLEGTDSLIEYDDEEQLEEVYETKDNANKVYLVENICGGIVDSVQSEVTDCLENLPEPFNFDLSNSHNEELNKHFFIVYDYDDVYPNRLILNKESNDLTFYTLWGYGGEITTAQPNEIIDYR